MRPDIEGVVDRWRATIKKRQGRVDRGAPCSVPLAFLETLMYYVQKLEKELEDGGN